MRKRYVQTKRKMALRAMEKTISKKQNKTKQQQQKTSSPAPF